MPVLERFETTIIVPETHMRRLRRMGPGALAWDLFCQTLANIRRNKLRSFLTLFGIAWGIASLVLMSALCEGFRVGQRKNMQQIGDNIVFLFGGRTKRQAGGERAGRRIYLKTADIEAIRSQCPLVRVVEAEQKTFDVPARSLHNSGRFLHLGVTPDYLRLRNLPASEGRHISRDDVAQGRRVTVLGHAVRKQLFENRREVIGQTVWIKNYPYQVIGLMSEKDQNSSYDGWDNDKVLIPATSLLRDCPPSRQVYAEGLVNGILYQPASLKEWEAAQHQVKSVLGRLHNFDPQDETALFLFDSVKSAELFDDVFNSTEIFLAAIALVTLSLGGIGVMNTMMMAVSERTNEIGLKKALGATNRRILTDFFLEGLFLAALSGVGGLLLTGLLAGAVNSLPLPTMWGGLPVGWDTVGWAALALGTVAVVSSLPPAWRASQLTPVEALRYER